MNSKFAIECLRELMVSTARQNGQMVIQMAATYWNQLGVDVLLDLFHEVT
jgi:hypothetical protein